MVTVVNNLWNSSLFNLTRQVEPSENLPSEANVPTPSKKMGMKTSQILREVGSGGVGLCLWFVCFLFLNFLNFYTIDVYVCVCICICLKLLFTKT